jgi:hypothetical protein
MRAIGRQATMPVGVGRGRRPAISQRSILAVGSVSCPPCACIAHGARGRLGRRATPAAGRSEAEFKAAIEAAEHRWLAAAEALEQAYAQNRAS